MITPLVFETVWHIDAAIVCAAALGLVWQLRRMQPVAQIVRVCAACRHIVMGSEEHGRVTEEIVVVRGRRR